MRLFVALRPPFRAREHLAQGLRQVRTTAPERWHVTVCFLGEVGEPGALLPGLRVAAAGCPPLRLALAGGGRFPGPRVSWVGLTGDTGALAGLAASVAGACRAAGVEMDDRPYRPHLTVARGRPVDGAVLSSYAGPGWRADEVELVASRPGPPVVHEVLERLPLGPGPSDGQGEATS